MQLGILRDRVNMGKLIFKGFELCVDVGLYIGTCIGWILCAVLAFLCGPFLCLFWILLHSVKLLNFGIRWIQRSGNIEGQS